MKNHISLLILLLLSNYPDRSVFSGEGMEEFENDIETAILVGCEIDRFS